jgi:AGCS family alanine or glycine:cation symporter
MPDFLSFINEVLWGSIMIYLLLGAGIWFTLRSGFIQFRYIRKFGKSLKNSITPQPGGLTSFQALCTSLAARVGSGNLAGVALAISAGGPGAVFWMWVTAIIGMATSFAECSLAQLYKEKDKSGQFRGGPAWYMARGLGMRWMGVLFSVFLLIAYGLIFNTVQANSVAHALRYAFQCPEWLTGATLAIFTLLTIVTGLKGVARLMQWLVPIMALLWVAASLFVMATHLSMVPKVMTTIFQSAFGWREAASGALGYTIQPGTDGGFSAGNVLERSRYGVNAQCRRHRGVLAPHPAAQGIVQMIGVFTDTIMICSASAMIVLLAGPMPHTRDGGHSAGSAGAGESFWQLGSRFCLGYRYPVCLQLDSRQLPLCRKQPHFPQA